MRIQRAFYDNLSKNESLALDLYDSINAYRTDNWIGWRNHLL